MNFEGINEPVILSSKSSEISFYASLIYPILLIGLGLYVYLEKGEVLPFLLGLAAFLASWLFRSKDETYITREAIYYRVRSGKCDIFRFSDLSCTWFDEDTVDFLFGREGTQIYSISDDARNYEEIRAYLEQVSKKHLSYHRYEFPFRSELSSKDKLGCLTCQSIFGYSSVTHWTNEKTSWSFRKPEIAVCPSCKKEGSVIVSRTGRVTKQGLKSMNDFFIHLRAAWSA